jgi:folate-binding protein YgfZ
MLSNGTISNLSFLAIIEISGADAESFLNAQFTSNIKNLTEQQLQFSAWCNPKGQVKTTFYIFRHTDNFYILLPEELKISFLKQLSMYILRADVQLADQSDSLTRLGVCVEKSDLEKSDSEKSDVGQADILNQIPDNIAVLPLASTETEQGQPRYIIVTDIQQAESIQDTLTEQLTESDSSVWKGLDIQTGIPWLTQETTEKFLPQMLNLDLMGALDYQKGCYPGQEIIARLYYRGELKRNLYLSTCTSDKPPEPGANIVSSDNKTVGTVIQAQTEAETTSLLAVIDNNSIQDNLSLCDTDGSQITISSLIKQTD